MRVAIIGQGYVGLSISVGAFKSGHEVVGVDLSDHVVESLKKGVSHIEGIASSDLLEGLESGRFRPTTDYGKVGNCEVVVLAVPTPIDEAKRPDLSLLESASREVGRNLRKKALIISESTSYPGTLRKMIAPIVNGESGFKNLFAISPERVDPGNEHFNVRNTPRLVGGVDEESLNAAVTFYRSFCEKVIQVSSPEVAEAAKLLENTFRYINIGFIDEFAQILNLMKIPVEEVIESAGTKPYGFMKFFPNIGIGGHCIPVDPHYFQQEAVKFGSPSRYIKLTSEINDEMPERLIDALSRRLGGISGKKCLLIGVSYKANIADTRETPATEVLHQLVNLGVEVKWYDPLVKTWNGEKSTFPSGDFDFGIVLVDHEELSFEGWGDAPLFSVRSNPKYPKWISLIDLGSET